MENSNLVPWAFALLSLIAGGGLYQQNKDMQSQLNLIQQARPQASSDTKKGEDPYLAGPVKNSIIKAAAQIQSCYLDLLKTKPKVTAGKLHLDWQIDSNGKVFGAGVIQNQLQNPRFGDCVVGKISAIHFPPPLFGRSKYVEHRLNFKDQAQLKADQAARKQGPLVQLPSK